MLTKDQKRRLAHEMRGLAMECVNNGPQMVDLWCGCAIGISLRRADLWNYRNESAANNRASKIDQLLIDEEARGQYAQGVVSTAVRESVWRANSTAVVFPLLALADLVEGDWRRRT